MSPRFRRFCGVGGIGFVVDAGLLLALMALGLGPFVARAISVVVAVTVTWRLNRTWTFRSRGRRLQEWTRYAGVSAAGAGVNYGTYSLVLLLVAGTPPFAALVVGSAVGLAFNYLGSKRLVFA